MPELPPHLVEAMEERRAGGLNALGDDSVLGEALQTAGLLRRNQGLATGIAVGLGLAAAAVAAWVLWPVPVLTYDEREALEDAGVTAVPPGRTACPASATPLGESPTAASVIGWDRLHLLRKEGWRFLEPVLGEAKAGDAKPSTKHVSPAVKGAPQQAKVAS
jgi:hypothetical protein